MKKIINCLFEKVFNFHSITETTSVKSESNNLDFFPFEKQKDLENILGIEIHNAELFHQALIHRSYLHLLPKDQFQSNERLEFLGDSVLNLIISEFLFSQYPNKPEGELTKMRSWLVNKQSLAFAAKKLELEKFVQMSFGTLRALERSAGTILSNALEALIGAIYLDSGIETARKFIIAKLIPILESEDIFQDKNYKSILMEKVQAVGKAPPVYKVLEESGPPHERIFYVGVYIDNLLIATSSGFSKKQAEQNAAKKAIEKLLVKNKE
ncbi:MAG: ribonuclease III [Ignavibacteria bacterium]|nr:ribonuclease III [Ignavibacteria bacterium]